MFKVEDRVVLAYSYPDDNEELEKGDQGTVIFVHSKQAIILVRWDKKTEPAENNNHLIRDYYHIFNNEANEDNRNYNDTYYEHTGHLWYVSPNDIKLQTSLNFRKKKKAETQLQYKIAYKIAELDYKWKEKQSAKTSNLSL